LTVAGSWLKVGGQEFDMTRNEATLARLTNTRPHQWSRSADGQLGVPIATATGRRTTLLGRTWVECIREARRIAAAVSR
jgi:hypothetical protein